MIRAKIAATTLPREEPVKLWVGSGSGHLSSACETPILASQSEYEPDYADGRAPIRLHLGCHGLWEADGWQAVTYSPRGERNTHRLTRA
jgi:hypothetical protein